MYSNPALLLHIFFIDIDNIVFLLFNFVKVVLHTLLLMEAKHVPNPARSHSKNSTGETLSSFYNKWNICQIKTDRNPSSKMHFFKTKKSAVLFILTLFHFASDGARSNHTELLL